MLKKIHIPQIIKTFLSIGDKVLNEQMDQIKRKQNKGL